MNSLASQVRQHVKEIKYAPVEKLIQFLAPVNRQAAVIHRYHRWKGSLRPALGEQLNGIFARHPNPRAVIVFTPSLDWARQLFQRPQQLAQALAKQGALVFYTQLNPPEQDVPVKAICDRLYVGTLPLDQFSFLEDYFIYSLTWNRKYLLKFDRPGILYDYVDDLSAFEGDTGQLTRDHAALLREADVVVTTAQQLYEEARQTRPDALYIPNGVEFDHFHSSQSVVSPPQEMAGLCRQGKPVIGYYGAFASWFDYTLLHDLAVKRIDLNFVLIGPRHDSSLDESGLLRLANVHYLGPKPYIELPAYLACFDTAILPFKVNKVTQATSPIKLFEYFAGGKPVVSTPLREVMQYQEVRIGQNSQEFSDKIDEALLLGKDAAFTARLLRMAQENTWESRAEQILLAVEQKRTGSAAEYQ